MAIYRKKKFTSHKKVGGPEIGVAHKSQKVGGPRPAQPNRLRRQWWSNLFRKSYDNADFLNYLWKSQEKVT